MDEDENSLKGALKRYGARRRDRLMAESRMGMGKYAMKLSLVLVCMAVDLLGIPSVFQALGIFGAGFAIPMIAVIATAAVAQFALLYRMK
ncbi:MAG: hypothetical protein OK441_07305 [Thaumarchaeota archaeon]|nr:hypothetical protein [Nitrososphaerota archaeon]